MLDQPVITDYRNAFVGGRLNGWADRAGVLSEHNQCIRAVGDQALDIGLEAVERLDLGVQLGFGRGHQGQLGLKRLLAGVQLTAAVAPWEEAKLRLLNGAHSGIAYLGGLAGIEHVNEVLALPEARRFVEALWDEAEATLSPPPELDIIAYRRALIARFDNPTLRHRTRQIAMDGSQKLPQRLLATIAARLEAGQGIDALSLAVAAWIRWQAGKDDLGQAHAVDDPLAAPIAAALADAGDARARVTAILAFEAIVPPALGRNPLFAEALTRWLSLLESQGARNALTSLDR